jgi:hypothetical protein
MRQRLETFLFAPASPLPLVVLRTGLALTLLLQAIYLIPPLFDLYGTSGILQGDLAQYDPRTPFGIQFWIGAFAHLGFSEHTAIGTIFAVYVTSLVALLFGWHPRLATFFTWFTHMLLNHSQTTGYGLDQFSHMALFLMLFFPWPDFATLRRVKPSWQARLSLRVLQLWLSIAYLGAGLAKAVGPQWWSGEAIWRSVMLPTFVQMDLSWLAFHPWIPRAAALGTLLVEIGYPFFIWPRRTRALWIALTIGMHLGIGVFLGLWLFALVMIVLTVSAFAISPEPRAIAARLDAPSGVSHGAESYDHLGWRGKTTATG